LGKKRDNNGQHPKVVLPRNEFGTRLCQRVVCAKCQKIDYVPVRISAQKEGFCRDCAEKLFSTYDQGRQIEKKKVNHVCQQCKCNFVVDVAIAKTKNGLLCFDCLRGFEVWRGKTDDKKKSGVKVRAILTKIGSPTTFRKKIHDTV
jgi:hypothetical protein